MAYFADHMTGFSNTTRANSGRMTKFLRAVKRAWDERHRPHVRDITDRAARDAGIDTATLEPHRHRLPSQHSHHPRG